MLESPAFVPDLLILIYLRLCIFLPASAPILHISITVTNAVPRFRSAPYLHLHQFPARAALDVSFTLSSVFSTLVAPVKTLLNCSGSQVACQHFLPTRFRFYLTSCVLLCAQIFDRKLYSNTPELVVQHLDLKHFCYSTIWPTTDPTDYTWSPQDGQGHFAAAQGHDDGISSWN